MSLRTAVRRLQKLHAARSSRCFQNLLTFALLQSRRKCQCCQKCTKYGLDCRICCKFGIYEPYLLQVWLIVPNLLQVWQRYYDDPTWRHFGSTVPAVPTWRYSGSANLVALSGQRQPGNTRLQTHLQTQPQYFSLCCQKLIGQLKFHRRGF